LTRSMSAGVIIVHQLPDAPPPPNEPPPPEKPPLEEPDHDEPEDPEPHDELELGSGKNTGPPRPRRPTAPAPRVASRQMARMIMKNTRPKKITSRISQVVI